MVIDTNIGLRYLLRDDQKSLIKANAIFESGEPILITDIVVAEMVYVMRGATYCKSRHQAAASIKIMLKNNNTENPSGLANTYLTLYEQTTIDLADCYLITYAIAEQEELKTFDKKMLKVYEQELAKTA